MSSLNNNRAYVKKLIERLRPIPQEAAKQVAHKVFEEVVAMTVVDSGQAAANWTMDFSDTHDAFKVMWGYTKDRGQTVISPIPPVGWKSSYTHGHSDRTTGNEEEIKRTMFSYATGVLATASANFKNIYIYNPINDSVEPQPTTGYKDAAMKNVESVISSNLLQLAEQGYAEVKTNSFVGGLVK